MNVMSGMDRDLPCVLYVFSLKDGGKDHQRTKLSYIMKDHQ